MRCKKLIHSKGIIALLLMVLITSCTGSKRLLYGPNDPDRFRGRVITTIETWNTVGDTNRKTFTTWRYRP